MTRRFAARRPTCCAGAANRSRRASRPIAAPRSIPVVMATVANASLAKSSSDAINGKALLATSMACSVEPLVTYMLANRSRAWAALNGSAAAAAEHDAS